MSIQILKQTYVGILFIFLITGSRQGLAAGALTEEEPDYNDSVHTQETTLILEGTALEIKPLAPPAVSDAVEETPGFQGLSQVVSFRVDKIIQGHLTESSHPQTQSKINSLKQIFTKRSSDKKLDIRTKPENLHKRMFSIAVTDPLIFLGLSPERLGKARYRLYLKRYRHEVTTFIMYDNVPLD